MRSKTLSKKNCNELSNQSKFASFFKSQICLSFKLNHFDGTYLTANKLMGAIINVKRDVKNLVVFIFTRNLKQNSSKHSCTKIRMLLQKLIHTIVKLTPLKEKTAEILLFKLGKTRFETTVK